MSSIFVPEVAISEAKTKFPAVFDKAVSKLKQTKETEDSIRSQLRTDDAASCIANREEEIWTIWANLCKASRV